MQKKSVFRRHNIRYAVLASVAALAACDGSDTATVVPAPKLAATLACDISTLQAQAPGAVLTSVTKVIPINKAASHCRVDGYITTQGPASTSNQVRFMVALPEAFNARYFFVGEGGSAGFIPTPTDKMLADGYVVAGSDAGSTTPGIDWKFAFDRTKAFDYAQRGVHVSTVATQTLARAYYGLSTTNANRRMYRYIDGCSGGGRMGTVAASWYPDDFDGVIAGAPGISVTNQMMFGKVSKYLIDHPDSWISPAQLLALDQALLAQYDGADGAVDGMISDPSLVSLDASMWALFTPEQQKLLHIVLDGMNDFGQTYPGYTLGNPIGWSAFMLGTSAPPWSMNPTDGRLPPAGFLVFDTTSRGLYGPTYDFSTQFSFTSSTDVNGWNSKFEEVFVGSGTAKAENMGNFFQRGGKMLFWHGAADNGISLNDTLRFYGDLAKLNGGQANLSAKARLFVAPGLQHCGGGSGPQDVAEQALPAIAQWVENGEAPNQLVTNRVVSATLPARSFLLCAYPKRATFRGGLVNESRLDVNDSVNWSCQS